MTCPKCNGDMVQGWIMDVVPSGRTVSEWAPGPPRESFWTGTLLPDSAPVPIGAFRCSGCGFLESYARHEFAPR